MHLKVANIILDPRFGGPQNRILQVAEKLKEYGIETVVIIPKKDSDTFYYKLVEKNIQVKRLNLHRLTKHKPQLIGWFFFFIPELFSLYRYLKKNNIHLIHCNAPWQMKGILAGRMAGAKMIWHLNDTELPRILKAIFNVVGTLCDGFIVAGSRVYQFYLNGNSLQKKKFIEIQAPVDTAQLDPEIVVGSELIGKDNGIKLMTMGTINPTKRIEDFIYVANMLSKKNDKLYFYIVGPELDSQRPYMSQLKELVRHYRLNNVSFLGARNDIPSILKAIDIYVCTSETEASPMAVWEAMAMEKAIVSTDVGDVSRYIRDGVNGFIVPPKDVEALAEKVGLLIENEDLRLKFGKLARAVAVKELDIEICAQKHKQFYLEVLGKEGTN